MNAHRAMMVALAAATAWPVQAQPVAAGAVSPDRAGATSRRASGRSWEPRDYQSACATCHDNGGYAVRVLSDRVGADRALIHKRADLEPEAIRAVVRNGIGAMPAISKVELSDGELDRIVARLAPPQSKRARR